MLRGFRFVELSLRLESHSADRLGLFYVCFVQLFRYKLQYEVQTKHVRLK